MCADANLTNSTPESGRTVSLVVDGCAMMDCARKISMNTEEWVQSDHARQRGSKDGRTRLILRYPTNYQLLANAVALLEGKGGNIRTGMVVS